LAGFCCRSTHAQPSSFCNFQQRDEARRCDTPPLSQRNCCCSIGWVPCCVASRLLSTCHQKIIATQRFPHQPMHTLHPCIVLTKMARLEGLTHLCCGVIAAVVTGGGCHGALHLTCCQGTVKNHHTMMISPPTHVHSPSSHGFGQSGKARR
jgi:hypothetical protein